jgi:hypothetical protein
MGYPLVIIGFILLMVGILMEAKPERYETIMGLLILGICLSMSGAACFFHALLTSRRIDDDSS